MTETPVKPLPETMMWEHGNKQLHYDVFVPAGVKPEDCLKREFWSHVTQRSLRPMTKLSLMADDRAWYAEAVVISTYTNAADIALTAGPFFFTKAAPRGEEIEFEVVDLGLAKKWGVRRLKDGRVILDGHETQAEANKALLDWLKAQGSGRKTAA